MYRHVLVTLDGSEASEAVLAQAARLADGAAAKITLLAVSGLPQAVSEAPGPRSVAGAPARGVGGGEGGGVLLRPRDITRGDRTNAAPPAVTATGHKARRSRRHAT